MAFVIVVSVDIVDDTAAVDAERYIRCIGWCCVHERPQHVRDGAW